MENKLKGRELTKEQLEIFTLIITHTRAADNVPASRLTVRKGLHELRYTDIEVDKLIDAFLALIKKHEEVAYQKGHSDLRNLLLTHATAENEDTIFVKIKKAKLKSSK